MHRIRVQCILTRQLRSSGTLCRGSMHQFGNFQTTYRCFFSTLHMPYWTQANSVRYWVQVWMWSRLADKKLFWGKWNHNIWIEFIVTVHVFDYCVEKAVNMHQSTQPWRTVWPQSKWYFVWKMFSFLGQWFPRCSKVMKWTKNTKYIGFMDAYHAPFTPKHRYQWVGLLLFALIIHNLVAAMAPDTFLPVLSSGAVSVGLIVCWIIIHFVVPSKLFIYSIGIGTSYVTDQSALAIEDRGHHKKFKSWCCRHETPTS